MPAAKKQGFTLIELLVVTAIIAVLASLLFPALARVRQTAQTASCLNNMRQSGLGIAQYSNDFNGVIPVGEGMNWATTLMQSGSMPNLGRALNTWSGVYTLGRVNNVFSCPALPVPETYITGGTTYSPNVASTATTLGVRTFFASGWYPGEKLVSFMTKDPGGSSHGPYYAPILQTLYAGCPLMTDTVSSYKTDASGTSFALAQNSLWYLTLHNSVSRFIGVHLRHNRKANALYPDGHATGMKASDFSAFKAPSNGGFSSVSPYCSYDGLTDAF